MLLHGAIPNNILNMSEYMFVAPAWSLSLEWQFYLIAPMIIFLTRTHTKRILLASMSIAGYFAYTHGWFGGFSLPSFLPGAAPYFAMGVVTRLVIQKIPRITIFPTAVFIICVVFLMMAHALVPFFIWSVFITCMLLNEPTDNISKRIKLFYNYIFNSTPIKFLGERSYSTYLAHVPIIQLTCYVSIKIFALSVWPTFAIVAITTPLLTFLSSIILYKFVEAPAIACGKRLFNEPT